VINAHWAIPPGFIAIFTKRLHKKPVVIKIYGAEIFPFFRRNNITSKIAKRIIKYALKKAEKVVSNSAATCKVGEELSGRKDIEVLSEGVDLKFFNPHIDCCEIIKREKLDGYHIIFSTGRMVERKGFRYLIEAMPHLLKEFPNIKLVLGGDGPERKNLEKLSVDLGVEDNVIFLGFISDKELPKFMKACSVFVLPSIVDRKGDTEGLGLVLLEAMACGTPVIGTNVGGIPYIIKNCVNGFLVEQKNPKQLAEKIVTLLKDEGSRRKIGKAGRKFVEENFSWETIAEKYIEIILETRRKAAEC